METFTCLNTCVDGNIFVYLIIGIVIWFIIDCFRTLSNISQLPKEKCAKLAIKGILTSKGWTYRSLWELTYGDKDIICLEDLTHEQMIELIKVGN
jgi:hypothetical protein